MADIGASIKGIWLKSMEAIGNTASSIANSTKSKVDEMNLVNRRAEILKDFGNQAYALWQQGERFPEALEKQLRELEKLDEMLNDLRAERLAGVKPEGLSVEDAETNGIPEDEKENQKNIIEPMDSEGADEPANDTIPVFQAGESEHLEKETGSLSDAINTLFDQIPSSNEAANKVNNALDSLEEGLKQFSDNMDQKIDQLSDSISRDDPEDSLH